METSIGQEAISRTQEVCCFRSQPIKAKSKLIIKHNPASNCTLRSGNTNNTRNQWSSFVLFLSVVILVNLCPFGDQNQEPQKTSLSSNSRLVSKNHNKDVFKISSFHLIHQLDTCLEFIKLMFTSPLRLNTRTTRFIQADAKVIGKMAKMWYIKKKIKKLSKKLKKHTIAVPVFTAIPIYEHPYYPHQQQVGHASTSALNHAASSYLPAETSAAVLPLTQQVANTVAAATAAQSSPQLSTSASDTHQRMAAYQSHNNHHHQQHHRVPSNHYHQQLAAAAAAVAAASATAPIYHHHHRMPSASAHQIINSYTPSAPLFVDEAGGLYGQYGNAYGRYDGGYQLW